MDDLIAEYTETFDVTVEAVNPLDSVSSMNTSNIYILDDDGNELSRELVMNCLASQPFLPQMRERGHGSRD